MEELSYSITPEEKVLIDLLRTIQWGEVIVPVQAGKLVIAKVNYPAEITGYRAVQTIKLNIPLDN